MLVKRSDTLMSLPEKDLQQVIGRFAQLDETGQQGMITLLEQQELEDRKEKEAAEKQIQVLENMTAKVIGAERALDRLVLQQQEQPDTKKALNTAENLLDQL